MYKTIENGVFCFNRGEEKFMSGEFQGAINDYTKLIELQPTSFVNYYNRGYFKMKSNKFLSDTVLSICSLYPINSNNRSSKNLSLNPSSFNKSKLS